MFGEAKIALRIKSEAELVEFERKAKEANLPHYLVVDAGRTQIAAGSKTVLAIGPAPVEEIDKLTKGLRLV